jgi:hypothetical protein
VDQATSIKVDRLCSILAVTHITALDGDHLDDGLEDRGLQECIGRHTDGDDCTAGTGVFNSLLEGLLRDGEQDHSVSTQSIGGSSLDAGDEILRLGEVNVDLAVFISVKFIENIM